MKIRLTKIFSFEMAHALLNYDGPCRNIHGHSYILHVTVLGVPQQEPGHPKNGMVCDFKDLKRIVKEKIIEKFDHALVLNEDTSKQIIGNLTGNYEKVMILPFQPTCELLLNKFAEIIQPELFSNISLHHMKLYETATSYAEWYASDNE